MNNQATRKILDTVYAARSSERSAKQKFDQENYQIQIKASSVINLSGGTAVGQVADIAVAVRKACDDLYAFYQAQIAMVDATCRPMLEEKPDASAVRAIRDLIRDFNEGSEINVNFTASFDGISLGDMLAGRYIVTIACKMIQVFWEEQYNSHPGRYAYEAEERRKADEAQRRADEKRKAEEDKAEHILSVKRECDENLKQYTKKVESRMEECIAAHKKSVDAQIDAILEQCREKEEELGATGFFKFGRKKELKAEIAALEEEVQELQTTCEEETRIKKAAESLAEGYRQQIEQYLQKRFRKEFVERANGELMSRIYNLLSQTLYPGLCVTEMQEKDSYLGELSDQKIRAVVRLMVAEGVLTKQDFNRTSYFSVCCSEDPFVVYKENPAFASVPCPLPPVIPEKF